jgi:lauroyl/myristoyl acyltransferase
VNRTLLQPPQPTQQQVVAPTWLKLRWQLETLGLRLLLALLQGRKHSSMRQAIRRTVRLAHPLLAPRLTTARSNLERVYGPGLNPDQRERLARQSLEQFFLSCLESIIEPVQDSCIEAEGVGLDALLQRPAGQGVIVGSLHLGCWDLGLRWLSERIDDLAVIYKPAHNPQADRLLHAARSANSHCHWISHTNYRAIFRWLHQGGAIVVMTDLRGRKHAPALDWLGVQTRFNTGPVSLSQRTGAPLFPVAHVREGAGRFRLIFGAPLQPQAGPDGLVRQAQALCSWQEPWIQAYPEQYYWINRRWRSDDGTGQRLRQLPPPGRG